MKNLNLHEDATYLSWSPRDWAMAVAMMPHNFPPTGQGARRLQQEWNARYGHRGLRPSGFQGPHNAAWAAEMMMQVLSAWQARKAT